jgi:type IV pilus assembly protein PilO
MSFEGTYEQLQDFLFRTRNLARLVTVNGVTYEEAEGTAVDEGIEPLLLVEIQAEVYFQPSEVPADAAPPAPAPPAPGEVTGGA